MTTTKITYRNYRAYLLNEAAKTNSQGLAELAKRATASTLKNLFAARYMLPDTGENYTTEQRYPIMAGMQFTYPGTKNNKMHEVGYYIVRLTWSHDHALVKQKEIKRVFY